ncbi:MAG: ABC transporter substrate-binding protein, partial [Tepidimonas sp.]|uniref:ABC transporter substrate-binding protein n=1 Tax=Tepidimonas sp. TaxID=2002775 RepID=UPI004055014B
MSGWPRHSARGRVGHWWLALWLICMGAVARAEVVVIDDRGVEVRLSQPPKRIVTLLPSLAESVCALGACERVVGVDRYTNWPAALDGVPRVGGGLDPHIERIVVLRPDIVLMATSSRAAERLQALGVPVAAFEPKTHADVQRVLLRLGHLLGVQGAERVWRDIADAIEESARVLPMALRGVRVYVEVGPGPYAAGASSFIGETLVRLGARNVVPAALGPFPKLNPEWVVRADPDLIVVSARSSDALAQRPGWAAMRAVRGGHVCALPPLAADV